MACANSIISVLAMLLAVSSCSGGNATLRSSSSSSEEAKRDGKNDSVDISQASQVIPITATNLAQVLVYTKCVGDKQNTCTKVRLGANIQVGSTGPVRFAIDTKAALAIKSSSWEFQDLPSGVKCESTDGEFAFNPLCSGPASLATTTIKATLALVANDGTTVKGDTPNSLPSNDGTIVGNFMRLSGIAGLTPSGVTYSGATAAFSEVWQDLVSGLHLTNFLYNAFSGNTDWSMSDSLCRNKVDSGDGTGKWRLPTIQEFCGAGYTSGCDGGLYAHSIMHVTFNGGSWNDGFIWSSSPGDGDWMWSAWVVDGGTATLYTKNTLLGVICVR